MERDLFTLPDLGRQLLSAHTGLDIQAHSRAVQEHHVSNETIRLVLPSHPEINIVTVHRAETNDLRIQIELAGISNFSLVYAARNHQARASGQTVLGLLQERGKDVVDVHAAQFKKAVPLLLGRQILTDAAVLVSTGEAIVDIVPPHS